MTSDERWRHQLAGYRAGRLADIRQAEADRDRLQSQAREYPPGDALRERKLDEADTLHRFAQRLRRKLYGPPRVVRRRRPFENVTMVDVLAFVPRDSGGAE